MFGSAIILGAVAYTMPRQQPPCPLCTGAAAFVGGASALHAKAWGKPWPQSAGTISKTEISPAMSRSVDDSNLDNSDDVDNAFAEKLKVPPNFHYQYFEEIQSLKSALGANGDSDSEEVLVVREEYEMLRQALEDEVQYFCSFVVTGHPGIGTTTFLFYVLLHRLERALPTAVQLGSEYYFIFDEQGAIVHSIRHWDPRLEGCWALVDSNDEVIQPCETFTSFAEPVIMASPPRPERWKKWIKETMGLCIISDLPSVPEIAAIAKELTKLRKQAKKQPLYDPSSTLYLVRKWGPSTRNILRSMKCAALGLHDPIEGEAHKAAMRICNNPSAFLKGSHDLMPQSEGSSVIFLRRIPTGDVFSGMDSKFIPTPHLLALFEKQRCFMH